MCLLVTYASCNHHCTYLYLAANCPHPVVENSINFLPPTIDNPPPKNYSYGDRVTIRCENCHKPIGGRVNLTCLEGGTWDGTPPVCECKFVFLCIRDSKNNNIKS